MTQVTPDVRARHDSRRRHLSWWLGVAVVVGLICASLAIGEYDLSSPGGREMFLTTRVPRTAALVLSGIAMAMCGLVMQLLTQNKFVEPTTTGTTEWAGLGLLLCYLFWPQSSVLGKMTCAVACAFCGTMLFFAVMRRVSLRESLVVPIIGIMLGAVVGSVTTFVATFTDSLQNLGIWFAGSFTAVFKGQYEILWLVSIVVLAVFILADRLTVAGLGQDVATNVGLNYDRLILIGTGLVALATGIVTVVVGNLPFLGLIVPNMVSLIRGDDLRSNLPWVCLVGTAVITACDLIARTIIAPFEIPVSVVLGVIGAIIFVSLIIRRTRG